MVHLHGGIRLGHVGVEADHLQLLGWAYLTQNNNLGVVLGEISPTEKDKYL